MAALITKITTFFSGVMTMITGGTIGSGESAVTVTGLTDTIGKYLMEDCLIIIDEAGVDFDNRKMKMTDEQVYFFKNHGHYQADIAFFSQSTDVDIKIRKLAVCHYEIKKFPLIRDLSYIKTIGRKIGIDDLTHQETEMFYYVHFLAGGIKLFWRRPYYKLFDTRYRHELPEKTFPKC